MLSSDSLLFFRRRKRSGGGSLPPEVWVPFTMVAGETNVYIGYEAGVGGSISSEPSDSYTLLSLTKDYNSPILVTFTGNCVLSLTKRSVLHVAPGNYDCNLNSATYDSMTDTTSAEYSQAGFISGFEVAETYDLEFREP